MIINQHDLVHAKDGGNGYHGRCKHCGSALVTDLGYCSWDDTKCIDREVTNEYDLPKEIRSYINFNGLRIVKGSKKLLFTRPYSDIDYTLEDIQRQIQENTN